MVPQTSFLETVGIFANARGSTENFCTLTRPAFTTSGGGGIFLNLSRWFPVMRLALVQRIRGDDILTPETSAKCPKSKPDISNYWQI